MSSVTNEFNGEIRYTLVGQTKFALVDDCEADVPRPYFGSGMVRVCSLESTTKTASRLAGSLSLAFSLML